LTRAVNDDREIELTRRQRLRRVVILCCSFGRNLAYYRTAREPAFELLLNAANPSASFWRQANASFLDIALLEWCKLIIDEKGWRKIVTDRESFERGLYDRLNMTADEYEAHAKEAKHFRDRFVAHLDSEPVMNIPGFDQAKAAVWYYHEHVVTREAADGDLEELAASTRAMDLGCEQCQREARNIYAHALKMDW
jgi:hypothetical protein